MLLYGWHTDKRKILTNRFLLFLQLMVIILSGSINFLREDIAYNFQFGFQDPGSFVMESIINLHHDIMFFLLIIMFKIVCLFLVILNVKVQFLEFLNKDLLYFIKEKDKKFMN